MERTELLTIRAIALLAAAHIFADAAPVHGPEVIEMAKQFEDYLKADLPAESPR